MMGDPLPDSAHISRYFKGSYLLDIPGCPGKKRISGAAFMLRPGEPGLSVDWLELLHPNDRLIQLSKVRESLASRLKISRTARIAVLKAGQILEVGRGQGRELRVTHKPELPDSPAHSEVEGLKEDDQTIPELIAQLVYPDDIYPAIDP